MNLNDFSKWLQYNRVQNLRGSEYFPYPLYICSCGSVVEHCISSAKGCGFDSQGTHLLMKMYNLNVIVSRFG